MKLKKLSVSIVVFAVLSGLFLSTAAASAFPNLPSSPVTMTVEDGDSSYFIITLSGVPQGYDVSNVAYAGWCLDRGHSMSRSIGLSVMLYSSLSPPALLASKPWNQINYLLNNKDGATVDDIQQALWHFIGWWNYVNLSPAAKTLVDEANDHSDFVPALGEIVGVICIPEDSNEQLALIEVTPILEPGYTPGFWKHNIGVALGFNPGKFSAFSDGTKLTAGMLQGYAATVGVTLQEAYDALTARGPGRDVVRTEMANDFNAAAGYGPFED